MWFSSSVLKPKIRHLFGRLAVKFAGDVFVIRTRALAKITVSAEGEGDDCTYAIFCTYSTGALTCSNPIEVARFRDIAIANSVQEALFASLGFRVGRLVKQAFFVGLPLLAVFFILSLAMTVVKSTPPLAYSPVPMSPEFAAAAGMPRAHGESSGVAELAAARASLKEKLKGEAVSVQDFVPPNYQFNPKIEAPAIAPPVIQCAPKAAPQVLSASTKTK